MVLLLLLKEKNTNNNNKNDNEILFSIKDTRIGIYPDILPKLFTKLATKSRQLGQNLDYLFPRL